MSGSRKSETSPEEQTSSTVASEEALRSALRSFGEQLRELRDTLRLSQLEFAERLSVKRQTISSWEQGITSPDVKTLFQLKQLARRDEDRIPIDLGALLGERRSDSGKTPLEYALRLLKAIDDTGIRGVYRNRAEALEAIVPFLETEERSISVVASSFMGVTRVAPQKVSALLKRKASTVDFRILMTHPETGGGREEQEERLDGSIKQEIREALQLLRKDWGVPDKNIKFYRGAPTVFLLFTPDRMLVNPYTYQTEAYKTTTLEVGPTPNADDLYSQYSQYHFKRPWESKRSVPVEEVLSAAS